MPVKKTAKKAARKPTTAKKAGKKATTRRTSPKKPARKPAKATTASKGVRKPTTARKAARKAVKPRKKPTTGVNFREGTDAAVAWEYVQAGGESRRDVQDKLTELFKNQKTRGGQDKPVSTVINSVVRRAVATGKWKVEQHWQVVPVDDASSNGKATPTTKTKITKKATKPANKKRRGVAKPKAARKTTRMLTRA